MRALILVLASVFAITSCKKKDEPTPAPASTTTGNQTTIYSYGTLGTTLTQYYDGNTYNGCDSLITAFFFTDPMNPTTTMIDAGTVTYNGNVLPSNAYVYGSGQYNIHQSNTIWAVSGSSVVPAINYTLTPNYPVFTGNTQLPDSFSINSGVSFNLNALSNCSTGGVFIQINDANGNTAFKSSTNTSGILSFSPSDLSALQPCFTNASVMIHWTNATLIEFGGKNYGFSSSLQHVKTNLKIKP